MTEATTTARSSVLKPLILSRGTLLTQDLRRARALFEEFLGLECMQIGPKRMLVRDRDPQVLRQRRGGAYWVMDVREVSDKAATNLFKHWGIEVASEQEVDRVHAFAVANKDRLGLKAVRKPRMQHGTHSFYAEDVDGNWWEVECRPPEEATDKVFARGDAAH
jgi:catechol 2,3-dioxygenase-like lactoylglutathione lyase family enzyme